MAWARLAETRIREAMDDGAFDDLPGAGRPVDLEEYFSAPEHLRMAHSVLKNANCVPVEVQLRREIATLHDAIAAAGDEPTKSALRRPLAERVTELSIRTERARRRER